MVGMSYGDKLARALSYCKPAVETLQRGLGGDKDVSGVLCRGGRGGRWETHATNDQL